MLTPEQQRITDVFFLAFCVWREARGESRDAQVAVAYSITTRVSKGGWWGNTIASVVTAPLQYSSMTYAKDPQLAKYPTGDSWEACMDVAEDVLDAKVPNPVPDADSYYDTSIKAPNWAKLDQFVKQIGRIRFYAVR